MKHVKLFEEFATLGNTPGMGDVTPPTATSVGSGDSWGSTAKFSRRKKKRKPVATNEDKAHYVQSALRLKPEEKDEILKLIPDAEFEIDSEGEPEDVRQLVWSDTHDEAAIRKAIQTVTKHP
jgi:hypothetical protein